MCAVRGDHRVRCLARRRTSCSARGRTSTRRRRSSSEADIAGTTPSGDLPGRAFASRTAEARGLQRSAASPRAPPSTASRARFLGSRCTARSPRGRAGLRPAPHDFPCPLVEVDLYLEGIGQYCGCPFGDCGVSPEHLPHVCRVLRPATLELHDAEVSRGGRLDPKHGSLRGNLASPPSPSGRHGHGEGLDCVVHVEPPHPAHRFHWGLKNAIAPRGPDSAGYGVVVVDADHSYDMPALAPEVDDDGHGKDIPSWPPPRRVAPTPGGAARAAPGRSLESSRARRTPPARPPRETGEPIPRHKGSCANHPANHPGKKGGGGAAISSPDGPSP